MYRICTRCVMDTTDPDIKFDDKGVCNHCLKYDEDIKKNVFSGEEGKKKLEEIIEKIKKEGLNKKYDCVIGLSGGVDSSYTAFYVKKLGLRPLAVHLDNGWDSELSVKNIEKLLKSLNIDLHTYVIDWEEFKDLQLSFLKASTPDSEIPSDHAIVSSLYHMAKKIGVRYIIPGYNIRNESHLPEAWSMGHYDWLYIKSIHKKFGKKSLRTFPYMDFFTLRSYIKRIKRIDILNYIDYNKQNAIKLLSNEIGWNYYGGKHYESIYTRFYQGYILPKKFGFDKRKTHFSSLICSGEMTRDEALEELKKEPYDLDLMKQDKEYVLKKLGLSEEEFENIMQLPKKTFWDYPSYEKFYRSRVYNMAKKVYKIFTFSH